MEGISSEEKELTKLSDCEVKYLMAIFELEQDNALVRVGELSRRLSLSLPTISIMVKKLEKRGLVRKMKRGYVKLSAKGRKLVLVIIKAHGIIEHLLVKSGLSPDEACCIASMIHHRVPFSTLLILWRRMGKPNSCPHGIPIILEKSRKPIICNRCEKSL